MVQVHDSRLQHHLQHQAAGPSPHAAAPVRLLQPIARLTHKLVAPTHRFNRGKGLQALAHAAAVLDVQAEVHERLPSVADTLARETPDFAGQLPLEHVLDEGGLAGGQRVPAWE